MIYLTHILSLLISTFGKGKYDIVRKFSIQGQEKMYDTFNEALKVALVGSAITNHVSYIPLKYEYATYYYVKLFGKYYKTYKGKFAGDYVHRDGFYIEDVIHVGLLGVDLRYINGKLIKNNLPPHKNGARFTAKTDMPENYN